MENQYAIEMLNITKKFPGIIANDNITLQLKKGEIHALLGENGAGKSTLMSVLFGLYQPEEGEIHKDGRKVEIRDPNDANALGIGMVPHVLAENIQITPVKLAYSRRTKGICIVGLFAASHKFQYGPCI